MCPGCHRLAHPAWSPASWRVGLSGKNARHQVTQALGLAMFPPRVAGSSCPLLGSRAPPLQHERPGLDGPRVLGLRPGDPPLCAWPDFSFQRLTEGARCRACLWLLPGGDLAFQHQHSESPRETDQEGTQHTALGHSPNATCQIRHWDKRCRAKCTVLSRGPCSKFRATAGVMQRGGLKQDGRARAPVGLPREVTAERSKR